MTFIHLIRSDSLTLVDLLNADLAIRNGADNEFYHQFNGLEALKNVMLAYGKVAGIGYVAFKEFNPDSVEIKRM